MNNNIKSKCTIKKRIKLPNKKKSSFLTKKKIYIELSIRGKKERKENEPFNKIKSSFL